MERARLMAGGDVGEETHVMGEVRFTRVGLAHYTMACVGWANVFSLMLYKKTYRDTYGWKVWHFADDLPLHAQNDAGEELVSCGFTEL